MAQVNLNEEKKYWQSGYEIVAGLDEAGRGPLAGPVLAAAVRVAPGMRVPVAGLRDSKTLSELQREQLYQKMVAHESITFALGSASHQEVDRLNILQATKLAMRRAVELLEVTLKRKAEHLLIDGNFGIGSEAIEHPIIAADGKVFSCAAAGIIAKVERDRIMRQIHDQYPQYGFCQHKGYGTRMHLAMLEKFGPCAVHRHSFLSAFR